MGKMFWGITLQPKKRYSQLTKYELHVSGVVLDLNSLATNTKKPVQVWVGLGEHEHLIANLCRQTTQFSLDIAFNKGEKVVFFTNGSGTVHLHGYFLNDETSTVEEKLEENNTDGHT